MSITYSEALAELEESLDHLADQIDDVLVREGLDEDQQHAATQKAYREIDKVRARGVAELDKIFSRIETKH